MARFNFGKTDIEGVYLIDDFFVDDKRGGFRKYFEKDVYRKAGIEFSLDETFASISAKNVVRGLHFQIHNPQAKLVSVIKGSAWDVAVDLRPNSPTYKKWICTELSEENHKSFYIPRGFAHGFAVLEDDTIMLYQCDGKYDIETDTGIIFNDPEIAVEWPVDESVAIHSERDLGLMSLAEYERHPMELLGKCSGG